MVVVTEGVLDVCHWCDAVGMVNLIDTLLSLLQCAVPLDALLLFINPISLPQSAQVTTNQPRPVLGLVPLCLTACMKRLREVLRQIGRRADLSSVRILPSVIPVTWFISPRFIVPLLPRLL
jgi:hypothetical protein